MLMSIKCSHTARRLRFRELGIVYAGSGHERSVKVRNTNKEIARYPLDLSLSPPKLLERVGQLAGKAYDVQAAEFW